MGVISFLPIQPGEGEPSPVNIRPIYAPLNIDGIGEIYGGILDTTTYKLRKTWHGVVIDGINTKVNSDYSDETIISAGVVYMPKAGIHLPIYVSERRKYVFCDSLSHSAVADNLPYWGMPSNGRLWIRISVCFAEDYEDLTDKQARLKFVNEWLSKNPAQFVYKMGDDSEYDEYSLTTAQLHQALDQLKTYFGGELPLIQMPEVRRRIIMNEPHLVAPAPAALHTFSTNMVAPLKECKIHFEPVQEGEGDPSPENVRTISGWSRVIIGPYLKYDEDGYQKYISVNGVITGGSAAIDFHYSALLKVATGDWTYNFTTRYSTRRSTRVHGYDCDGVWVRQLAYLQTSSGTYSIPFAVTDEIKYIRISNTFNVYEENIQCNAALKKEINWSTIGEIHGGYADPVEGEIVQTWDSVKVKDVRCQKTAATRFTLNMPRTILRGNWNNIAIADNYRTPPAGKTSSYADLIITTHASSLYITDSRYETAAEFKTAMGETVIAYQLAEPIHHQIPIETLKTLRGINNIWSNANGNIDLAYWTH